MDLYNKHGLNTGSYLFDFAVYYKFSVRTGSPVRISKTFQSPLTQISKTTPGAKIKPNSWI
jgi:hypothetical protein